MCRHQWWCGCHERGGEVMCHERGDEVRCRHRGELCASVKYCFVTKFKSLGPRFDPGQADALRGDCPIVTLVIFVKFLCNRVNII